MQSDYRRQKSNARTAEARFEPIRGVLIAEEFAWRIHSPNFHVSSSLYGRRLARIGCMKILVSSGHRPSAFSSPPSCSVGPPTRERSPARRPAPQRGRRRIGEPRAVARGTPVAIARPLTR
eukprot:scaffold3350_cov268-Pinguiococcus_pyrenoidosus.AAC.22